jgi:lantibiotic transport system permease protein
MIARIWSSDIIKTKRTSLWMVTFLVPIVLLLFELANFTLRRNYHFQMVKKVDGDWWFYFLTQTSILLILSIPVGITIICSIVANMEHQSKGWKQILALPVSCTSIYVGKYMLVVVSSLLSALGLFIGTLLFGLIFGFGSHIPWVLIIKNSFLPYLAAFPIIAFQLWLSTVFKNQAFSIAIGTIMSMAGFFLAINPHTLWLPWTYHIQSMALHFSMEKMRYVPTENGELLKMFFLSLIIGIIMLLITAKDFTRRDMS